MRPLTNVFSVVIEIDRLYSRTYYMHSFWMSKENIKGEGWSSSEITVDHTGEWCPSYWLPV